MPSKTRSEMIATLGDLDDYATRAWALVDEKKMTKTEAEFAISCYRHDLLHAKP